MRYLLLLALFMVAIETKKQTVAVTRVVACNQKVVSGATVELWERDTFDPNDLLNSTTTDETGNFNLVGSTNEFTAIEPFILLKHNCNVKNDGCIRTTEYKIPDNFINNGTYDMTWVILDAQPSNYLEKC